MEKITEFFETFNVHSIKVHKKFFITIQKMSTTKNYLSYLLSMNAKIASGVATTEILVMRVYSLESTYKQNEHKTFLLKTNIIR